MKEVYNLLPCPFCGSSTAPYLYHDTDCNMYYVFCDNCEGDGCGASGAQCFDPQLASECWNTRQGKITKTEIIEVELDDQEEPEEKCDIDTWINEQLMEWYGSTENE